MRIAYLTLWSGRLDAGVMKKLDTQVAHWQRAGHEARVFMLRRTDARTPDSIVNDEHSIITYGPMWERPRALRRLMASVVAWQPSLAYARYGLWWPSLRGLARRVPVVLEINDDDVLEKRLTGRLSRRVVNRTTRRAVLSTGSGLVFVTNELSANPRFRWCRGRSTVIANSFDLESARPMPPSSTMGTRIVFLGTGEPWHGVDQLLRLAELVPEWDFDLIGVAASDVPPVAGNVHCHGFLSKRAYEPVLRDAHVAVGSLALHRDGLDEASPLKVREYLAYGLPTIIAYRDTDFPDGAPFLLRIPNEPGGTERSVEAIRTFVDEWRGRRVERSSIRHIDTAVKEAKRLEFFADIVNDEPTKRRTP